MPHLWKVAKHDGRALLRRGDKPPGAPLTGMAGAEADVGHTVQIAAQGIEGPRLHSTIDMDDDRAAPFRPVARDLCCAVKGGVAQHNKADGHAQFPFDIRPRISSWRQLMYFSLHLHQRSGWLSIALR